MLESKFSDFEPIDTQSGTLTMDELSYNQTRTAIVTFENSFNNIPTVTATVSNRTTAQYTLEITDITRSGFIVSLTCTASAAQGWGYIVDWIAEALQ